MSIVCLRIEDRGSRIEDRGSLLYSCQHYCYRQQKFFHLFIYLFAFHRMPSNLFQKLLLHLFNMGKSLA